MKVNKDNMKYLDDEINLKDIFMSLWKKKYMIISLAIITTLLAGLFSKFFIPPVYQTRLNIIINMPEIYSTRYGDYELPITNNEQYIYLLKSNSILSNTIEDMDYGNDEISIENLYSRITINKISSKSDSNQNSFEVIISADDPMESLKIANSLFENYKNYLNIMTKERAITYFDNAFQVNVKYLENQLEVANEALANNKSLLANTSPTISNKESNIEIQSTLTENSSFSIPVNTVNPNYIKIESDIIVNIQEINNLERSIKMYNRYLEEIEIEKQMINKYNESEIKGNFESKLISVVDASVYLSSPPVAPSNKVNPNNILNAAIGTIFGLVIGVLVTLIREYWFEKQ